MTQTIDEELAAAKLTIAKLRTLIELQRVQIEILTERRAAFELSADSTPMLLRRQAG